MKVNHCLGRYSANKSLVCDASRWRAHRHTAQTLGANALSPVTG